MFWSRPENESRILVGLSQYLTRTTGRPIDKSEALTVYKIKQLFERRINGKPLLTVHSCVRKDGSVVNYTNFTEFFKNEYNATIEEFNQSLW